jgi:plastocyanin
MNRLMLLTALAPLVVGCSKKSTAPLPMPTDASIAASLWQTMTDEHYDVVGTQWKFFPGKMGKYGPDTTLFGSDPHLGPTHFQTFVNAAAYGALASNTFPLPDQSIIAKQNYVVSGSDTTLAAITVMLKRAGYNPTDDDWFWVKFKPDGHAEAAGKIQMCISCHKGSSAKYGFDRDYVWTRTSPGSNTPFDSGLQNAGFVFTRVFPLAGNVPYFCIPHHSSGMTGTVTVSASSSTDIADVTVGPGGSLTFDPASVTVKVGGRVRWTWGSSGHTVTSGTALAGAHASMADMPGMSGHAEQLLRFKASAP